MFFSRLYVTFLWMILILVVRSACVCTFVVGFAVLCRSPHQPQYLAISTAARKVVVWDISVGTVIREWELQAAIHSLAWCPVSDDLLLTGCEQGRCRRLSLSNARVELLVTNASASIIRIAFHPSEVGDCSL